MATGGRKERCWLSTTPAVRIQGTDTYEWVCGGRFLLHRVEVTISTIQPFFLSYPPIESLMKKLSRLSFAAYILLTLTACSSDDADLAGVSDHELKEIQSAVINRFNAMIKYSEAGELENMLQYFDPSGPGSYIDGGKRFATFQDMLDEYRATWKVRGQDYGVPETKMYVLSRKFVSVTSTAMVQTTNVEGVVFRPRPWSVSTLWMRTNKGEWEIHSFHQYAADLVPVDAGVKN